MLSISIYKNFSIVDNKLGAQSMTNFSLSLNFLIGSQKTHNKTFKLFYNFSLTFQLLVKITNQMILFYQMKTNVLMIKAGIKVIRVSVIPILKQKINNVFRMVIKLVIKLAIMMIMITGKNRQMHNQFNKMIMNLKRVNSKFKLFKPKLKIITKQFSMHKRIISQV